MKNRVHIYCLDGNYSSSLKTFFDRHDNQNCKNVTWVSVPWTGVT